MNKRVWLGMPVIPTLERQRQKSTEAGALPEL